MAEHRYGKEELLQLFGEDPVRPSGMPKLFPITRENFATPLAFMPLSEEEQVLQMGGIVHVNMKYVWISGWVLGMPMLCGMVGLYVFYVHVMSVCVCVCVCVRQKRGRESLKSLMCFISSPLPTCISLLLVGHVRWREQWQCVWDARWAWLLLQRQRRKR